VIVAPHRLEKIAMTVHDTFPGTAGARRYPTLFSPLTLRRRIGAEVTSYGGHLIEQFFDPNGNTRADRYGGPLPNRVRFAREVLQSVRRWTSDNYNFLVGFRMTADQGLPAGGMSVAELEEVAAAITAGGAVDLLNVSNGTGYTARSTSAFVPGRSSRPCSALLPRWVRRNRLVVGDECAGARPRLAGVVSTMSSASTTGVGEPAAQVGVRMVEPDEAMTRSGSRASTSSTEASTPSLRSTLSTR
jgi:hypothetical protein